MKQIPLTQGKITLVDDDIYAAIGHFKWYALKSRNTWYAVRNFVKDNGKQSKLYLHHCVIGLPLDNNEVDHKDGDGLNNQNYNLRIVSGRFNSSNRHDFRSGSKSSQYSGVTWFATRNKWKAALQIKGRNKHLGYFDNEQDASAAYQTALKGL